MANTSLLPAPGIPTSDSAGTRPAPFSVAEPWPVALCLSNSTERMPPPQLVKSTRTKSLLSVTISSAGRGAADSALISGVVSAVFSAGFAVSAGGTGAFVTAAIGGGGAGGVGGGTGFVDRCGRRGGGGGG